MHQLRAVVSKHSLLIFYYLSGDRRVGLSEGEVFLHPLIIRGIKLVHRQAVELVGKVLQLDSKFAVFLGQGTCILLRIWADKVRTGLAQDLKCTLGFTSDGVLFCQNSARIVRLRLLSILAELPSFCCEGLDDPG